MTERVASANAGGDMARLVFPSLDAAMTGGAPTRLVGLLRRPPGKGPFPAVVMLHGCGGLYARSGQLTGRHEHWAQALCKAGFVTLLVDSFSPRGLKQICTMKERPLRAGRERTMDAYGALQFLQGLPYVRGDGVGLLGWSHGGVTTLFSVDPMTPARPRLPPEVDFRAAVAFYPGCRPDSQHAWRANIPLLMLLGAKDDWCPAHHCVTVAERAKAQGSPIDVVVYPDAHHDFDAPDLALRQRSGLAFAEGGTAMVGTNPAARADALQRVPAFLHQHLRPLI